MSFQTLFDFESALAEYTRAPYVVLTDGCTHAIELVMKYYHVKSVQFTAFTYISIPQTMSNLGIRYQLTDEEWTGEYQFHGTNVWDSARRLQPGMYRSGQIQCLSFGNGKPLQLGKCGAILLDDATAYRDLSMMRSDGRDLTVSPWIDQALFRPGWHYCPTLETCELGLTKLPIVEPQNQKAPYPDCRKISIIF
jgi:dTDP-4-amino-4,6-dideoxygalactose transaminase